MQDLLLHRLVLDEVASHAAAVQHEVDVIQLRKRFALAPNRFDDPVLHIVHQEEDVRHLQLRAGTEVHARPDALLQHFLTGADLRLFEGVRIELLEVHKHHEPLAHAAVNRPFDQDEALRQQRQHAVVDIAGHDLLGALDALVLIRHAEVDFRQHDMQRRGAAADDALHLVPIGLVRRILIAGDYGPFTHIDLFIRQQCFRHGESDLLILLFHIPTSFHTASGKRIFVPCLRPISIENLSDFAKIKIQLLLYHMRRASSTFFCKFPSAPRFSMHTGGSKTAFIDKAPTII